MEFMMMRSCSPGAVVMEHDERRTGFAGRNVVSLPQHVVMDTVNDEKFAARFVAEEMPSVVLR